MSCIVKDFYICITSHKYTSVNGKFFFRYPKEYPLSFKTRSEIKDQYNISNNYIEWINFSKEFYPNAGGDRLGSIVIYNNPIYESIDDYAKRVAKDYSNLPEDLKGFPPKIGYIIIGGEKAVRITTSRQPSSFDPPSDSYVLIYEKRLYSISFDYDDYYHKLPKEYYNKSKEIILSTFTFNK